MRLFNLRQTGRIGINRTPRHFYPGVDGVESRLLMSGATINGAVLRDITGNGASSDDTGLAGVTVNLYKSGSSQVFESTSSASNGSYSFKGLSAGSYSVQQVVPANYLATEGLSGQTVSLTSGGTVNNKNFDDFKLLPNPVMTSESFVVTTPGGKSSTYSSLGGHIQQGDKVQAKFNLKTAEQITLVAYTAPNGNFDTSNLQQQVIFSEASTNGASGSESLTVTVPGGYFQVDFVVGPAIDHLDTNPNILYHAQDRYLDGQQGGSQVDPKVTTTPVDLSVAPSVVVMSKMVAPSAVTTSKMYKMVASSVAPSSVAMSKMTKMVANDVVSPVGGLARKH